MEDRIKKLEKMAERLARRSRKVVTGLVTPYPISIGISGEDIKGSVFRYMFPCDGRISKGMVRFLDKPKGTNSIEVRVFGELTSSSKGASLDKRLNVIDLDIPTVAGDCLDVTLATTIDHPVTEIWISFLWVPSIRDVEAKSYLIDELDSGE